MSNKLYAWLLAVTLLVCIGGTLGMIFYTVDAYEHSSIVHYIGSEWW